MDRIERPRNERSRRTRAAILDATWRLLEEEGGAGVSMGEVARRAGVSRRALYLHFASRSELLMALHAHVDEVLDLEASVIPVRAAPDAVAMLEAFAAHLARYHPRIVAIDRAVDVGRRSGDTDLAALWEAGLRMWLEGCRAIASALDDDGRLASPWTVETAADMLLALMRDDIIETLAIERRWSEDRLATLLGTLFRRTFVADPGGGTDVQPAANR